MSKRRSAFDSSAFGQEWEGEEVSKSPQPAPTDPHLSWLPTAERKPRARAWEKKHKAATYRGVPPGLHAQIKEIAGSLQVTVDEAARAFLEYGERCYQLGKLKIEPVLAQKLTLFPEGRRPGWYENPAGSPRPKMRKPKSSKPEKTQAWRWRVSYRLPAELKASLDKIRRHKNVPAGEVVALMLGFALEAYEAGRLVLEPQPKQEAALHVHWNPEND